MNDATPTNAPNRRPLATRSTAWARLLASRLVAMGASPNAISLMSLVCAAAGAWLLAHRPGAGALLLAAACVQLRLLCNLLDGMVAIEGGRRTATGALYNEIPDRLADSLFIVALGYATDSPAIGWFGALAAAVTAYIRVLGGSLGLAQDFRGPLAKQQRMAALTAGCVFGAGEAWLFGSQWILMATSWLIAIGASVTCATRTRALAQALRTGA